MHKDLYQQGLIEHQAHRLDAAEKIYRKILAIDPDNCNVLHLLGILYSARGDYLHAKEFLERAIKADPQSTQLYSSLGNVLKHLNDFVGAEKSYKEAIQLSPNFASAYNNLANLYYAEEKLSAAKEYYHKALDLKQDYADAHCNLGLVLIRENDLELAKIHFQACLKLEPRHVNALLHLANILQLENNLLSAAKNYQNALKIEANLVTAHHNLATILVAKAKYGAAYRHLKKVLSLEPDHLEALHNLGAMFLLQKNPSAALKYFLRLSQLIKSFDAHYNLGIIYMDLGRYADAIIYLEQALQIQPNDFGAHNNLGAIYLKKADYVSALKHYTAAISVKPDNSEIAYIIAAITQKNMPAAAPKMYLQHLFDQYAPYYEKHLSLLQYEAPEALFKAVQSVASSPQDWQILDLGCGTGICGVKFKQYVKKLIGIDLSANMLEVARQKNVYHELKEIPINTALLNYNALDLIIAADVFPYLGDLSDIFTLCSKSLKKGGIFAFTTEKTTEFPFILQQTARYAHSEKYIIDLALKNNFSVCKNTEIMLRKQKDTEILGFLCIFISG
ncbi:MAG: tetratricopeptide repeat protein [Gammaproteobacteria bacterium]|nr:tetratricopeptide repeat protein [Gammaproteobacteria bacterium]